MGSRSSSQSTGQVPLAKEAALASAASSLLNFEYFEAGPGRLPSATSQMHNLLISDQDHPLHAFVERNGERAEIRLEPDEIVVTPAGMATSWVWPEPIKVMLIWIEPMILKGFIEDEMRAPLTGNIIGNDFVVRDPELVKTAKSLRDAIEVRDVGTQVVFESWARIFLVTLVRNRAVHLIDETQEPDSMLSTEQFQRLGAFVDAQLAEKITVARMAKVTGMSAARFSTALKRTVGTTPGKYLLQTRLQRARKALCTSDETLSQIAQDCGFADQAHMSRAFKARFGLPPRLFRRQLEHGLVPIERVLHASEVRTPPSPNGQPSATGA